MRPPCEIVVNRILPSVRAELVRVLINEHGMRQVAVAEMFGITQASVSQYLTQSRGKDDLLMGMFPEIQKLARETAKDLVEKGGTPDGVDPWVPLCEICKKILGNPKFESYRAAASLRTCPVCPK